MAAATIPNSIPLKIYLNITRASCEMMLAARLWAQNLSIDGSLLPDIAKSQSETKADKEFAQAFVSKKLVVFSRSLDSVEGKNTRIVRTDLRDEILKLKQEPGKDILVGGVDVPSQLMELA